MSTIEEHRYHRTNLENTALRKENERLREAIKEIKFQTSLVETEDNVIEAIDQALQNK